MLLEVGSWNGILFWWWWSTPQSGLEQNCTILRPGPGFSDPNFSIYTMRLRYFQSTLLGLLAGTGREGAGFPGQDTLPGSSKALLLNMLIY